MNIRTLRADEIGARVQTVKENGCSILLDKDARCDMRILDETFGVFGWQRKHDLIGDRLYCTVSIYDRENDIWIDKQDVGTESYIEKEKGQASDSFKRACFNIGIGRELYTSPFIWVKLNKDEVYKNGTKYGVRTKFSVKEIGYNENKKITRLVIIDDKKNVRYELGKFIKSDDKKVDDNKNDNKLHKDKADTLNNLEIIKEIDVPKMIGYYKVSKVEDMTLKQWQHAMNYLKGK